MTLVVQLVGDDRIDAAGVVVVVSAHSCCVALGVGTGKGKGGVVWEGRGERKRESTLCAVLVWSCLCSALSSVLLLTDSDLIPTMRHTRR